MLDDLTTRDQRMMFAVVTLVHLANSKAGKSLCGSRPGRLLLAGMKLRKRLPGSVPGALCLRSALPSLFRKSRFICGRTRQRSKPGKVSGRRFSFKRVRFCRTWNLRFLTRDRPTLSSRRSTRSSAAEHSPCAVRDKGPPICSHGSRKHFQRYYCSPGFLASAQRPRSERYCRRYSCFRCLGGISGWLLSQLLVERYSWNPSGALYVGRKKGPYEHA